MQISIPPLLGWIIVWQALPIQFAHCGSAVEEGGSTMLSIEHNKYFYKQTDMTISGMVLDRDQPRDDVKDAVTQSRRTGALSSSRICMEVLANLLGPIYGKSSWT